MSYLITMILFYAIPVSIFVAFVVSLCLFLVEKKKEKQHNPGFNPKKKLTCKVLTLAFGVILGIMVAVVVGLILLLMSAVAFM